MMHGYSPYKCDKLKPMLRAIGMRFPQTKAKMITALAKWDVNNAPRVAADLTPPPIKGKGPMKTDVNPTPTPARITISSKRKRTEPLSGSEQYPGRKLSLKWPEMNATAIARRDTRDGLVCEDGVDVAMEYGDADEVALSTIAEEDVTEASNATQVGKYSSKLRINLPICRVHGVVASEKGIVKEASQVNSKEAAEKLLGATMHLSLEVLIISTIPILPTAVEFSHQEHQDGSKRAVIKRRSTRAAAQQNRNTLGVSTSKSCTATKSKEEAEFTTSRKAAMSAAPARPDSVTDEDFETSELRIPYHESSNVIEAAMTIQVGTENKNPKHRRVVGKTTNDPSKHKNASPGRYDDPVVADARRAIN